MPKDKKSKKRAIPKTIKDNPYQTPAGKLTSEQYATIVKNRLATRPVIVWRYPNGKYNKRFIITLAVLMIALIAALYFISVAYKPA